MAEHVNYIRAGARISQTSTPTMEKGEALVMNGAGVATDLVSGWLVAAVVGSIWFGA